MELTNRRSRAHRLGELSRNYSGEQRRLRLAQSSIHLSISQYDSAKIEGLSNKKETKVPKLQLAAMESG